MEYKIIKDINLDNFIFGGMIYHHKEVIDTEERDRLFQKMVDEKLNKNTDKKTIYDVEEYDTSSIYSLKAELQRIKKSQSLSEMALNKTMMYFGNDAIECPIDNIYNTENHNNVFIDKGIKILNTDTIIFVPMKGIIGDIFDFKNDKQRLGIIYKYYENLEINIGEVIDLKVYEDFLNYKEHIGDIK